MNKICILLVLMSSIGLGDKGCSADKRSVNTEIYHKQTKQLRQNMLSIDSLAQLVVGSQCEDLVRVDSIQLKYQKFCAQLQNYDNSNVDLIDVKDGVVKSEIIELPSVATAIWLQQEFEKLDSVFVDIRKDAKKLNSDLAKGCLKKYNYCEEIKKNNGNKTVLKAINELVVLKNKSAAERSRDSVKIMDKLETFRSLKNLQNISKFYEELLIGLSYDIRFAMGGSTNIQMCNDAHIRWAALEKACIQELYACEEEHLEEISKSQWGIIIDSSYILQQAEATRQCAIHPRGCMCEAAINFDSLAVIDNETCIGCMDSLAMNFCPNAKVQNNAPCQYAACNDRCYAEKIQDITTVFTKFKVGRDIIVHVDSLCGENLCGCMNPCATNYDPNAQIPAQPDICQGLFCGCLDSNAVNYARRKSPAWAYDKYYNPKITKHDSTQCIYTGCMNICSLNYDPLAIKEDGSCICDSVALEDLEQMIIASDLQAANMVYSPQKLKKEFDQFIKKQVSRSAKKISTVDFNKVGWDLQVNLNVKNMKIMSKGEQDGIPLGEYNFKPVNELIDGLITFLDQKTNKLSSSMLDVKIVGEADAHPIRPPGLTFQNASRLVHEERYKMIPDTVNTDIKSMNQPNFDLVPDKGPITIYEGNTFTDNITLAFLRGYMVKQKIKDAEPSIDEARILIGAKVNAGKGGQYRRIGVTFTLSGFYKIMSNQAAQNNARKDSLIHAIEFFEKEGFPTSQKTYYRCPCY